MARATRWAATGRARTGTRSATTSPAYLINAWLATGDDRVHRHAGLHRRHHRGSASPTTSNSPFVQERFHEDWSHDLTWGWQQNRAVVGPQPQDRLEPHAHPHACGPHEHVPGAGREDRPRRCPRSAATSSAAAGTTSSTASSSPARRRHRFTWHDRKAWWQQEQAILAYLILAGTTGDDEALRLARESAAFYNAFFLDYDDGSVYFNVLASGIPYLLGTERLKGSHSMAGYHSFELAYLAAVYYNLLITKEPMDLYFSPHAGGPAG